MGRAILPRLMKSSLLFVYVFLVFFFFCECAARLLRPDALSCQSLTHNGEFAWALLGGDDLQRRCDGLNADDRLIGVISARHRQLQVSAHQQLRRHVL